jgi:hypothetical protein
MARALVGSPTPLPKRRLDRRSDVLWSEQSIRAVGRAATQSAFDGDQLLSLGSSEALRRRPVPGQIVDREPPVDRLALRL